MNTRTDEKQPGASSATAAFALFDRYLSVASNERADFVARALPADPVLRAEFMALVDADQRAEGSEFLHRSSSPLKQRVGERVGRWRLLRQIGSGGSGTVYQATSVNEDAGQSVAIKLLSANVGDLRERFLQERDILRSLNHPNIAALIDVGVDERGAPYMVLEYIDGEPITQYVKRRSLSLPARLVLFKKVLSAVQDAHVHLIVHRDIKPSNILVDAQGEPKLLDFGISKLLDGGSSELTRTGVQPMTPDYASPEQVRGEAITTATDVYSLGVLLYELLTDKKPYEITEFNRGALEQAICNTEPERPSRATTWRRTLGGASGLDAIVLKAMTKLPRHRYASCAAMAEDIDRWLVGRPVAARNVPWSDRFALFCKRHILALSVSGAVALALGAGAVAFVWQAQETAAAKLRADRVNQFLRETISAANPDDLGRDATITQVMARAVEVAEKSSANDPVDAAEVWLTLANTYESLGDFPAATRCARNALKFARSSAQPVLIGRAEHALGGLLIELREMPEAEQLLTSARKIAEKTRDAQFRANTANRLGLLHNARGDDRAALRWYQIALADGNKDDIGDQAVGYANVASKLCKLGDCAAGIGAQRRAIALLKKAHSKPNTNVAMGLSNLAGMLLRERKIAESVPLFDEALKLQVTLLGEQHPDAIYSRATFARSLVDNQQVDAALTEGSKAYALSGSLSPDSTTVVDVAQIYGDVLCRAKRYGDAIPVLNGALDSLTRQVPNDEREIASTESLLGLAMAGIGQRSEGRALSERALAKLLALTSDKHRSYLDAQIRLQLIDAMPK